MVLAIGNLPTLPDFVLIDGPHGLNLPIPQKPIRKGDQLCNCIAAASIIAKVTRDHLIEELDSVYPGYGLAQHKGYGTREHLSCLRRLGPSPIHRRSYQPVAQLIMEL